MDPIVGNVIAATIGLLGGYLARKPNKIDRDSQSWKQMQDVVNNIQEEMQGLKEDRKQLHQDLVESKKNGERLEQELRSTQAQLHEVKLLLREAISRLKQNSIDVKGLDDELRSEATNPKNS